MNYTTRTVTLPDDHWTAIEDAAFKMQMSSDKVITQAIRLYQSVGIKAEKGLQIAFVDQSGNLVREPVMGLPALD